MTKMSKEEIQHQALLNAITSDSTVNYQAIVKGFTEKGIDPADIIPRQNVFTFNAWKRLGRVVRKGEHGVKIIVVIECDKKVDDEGKIKVPVKKPKSATVFHISQTEPLVVQDYEAEAGSPDTNDGQFITGSAISS